MSWYATPYSLLLLIPPIISAAAAVLAWRRRTTPGARSLVWLALSATMWSLTSFLELHSATLPAKLFWRDAQYLGIAATPPAWLAFALEYTGQGGWLTRRNVALLTVAALFTIGIVWTNSSHSLYYSSPSLISAGPFITLRLSHGPLFWANLVYSYSMISLGTLFILKAFLQAPPWLRGQAGVVLAGGLVPWAANGLYQSGLIAVDLAPFSFSLTGLAMLWGILRLWLLRLAPVAREAVVRGMDDGMIVLNSQRRIVNLNPAAERIVGRPAGELIGQPATEALSPQVGLPECEADLAKAHLEVLQPGEGRFYDVRCSSLRGPHGTTAGYLLAWRDITKRRQAEEALRRSNAELQARNEELDAFAHTVAHDLKASLNIVVSAASLLRQDRELLSPSEIETWLHSIMNNGMRMSRTTDALLLLARVRQGQVPVEPVDMTAIVAEVCQRLASTIDEFQAEIVTPTAWPAAVGYGPWLEEVWANLIDNAIKYGGRPPRGELGYTRGTEMVEFWIRDNGSGLTPEDQASLFTPFSELSRSRGRGHGLGLSIVRRIVDRLGGQVGVASEGVAGQGVTFSFTLPGAAT